jgi:4-amino-4-deoxy-L-arabinose transferase-like glycosyltransferase
MFRFNNPDALMTLLIVLAAYCVTRALDAASTRWLLVAGLVIGVSFLAKGLQPFTVLPALALGYLVAAPTPLRRRLLQLLAAGGAIVIGAGWWLLVVGLTPAGSRPYIGGSGDNTALGLAFGYNGFSRLSGDSGPGGGAGGGFSGATGVGRLFNALNGGQISWLLPAAVVAMLSLLVLSSRTPRTDRNRAALIIWGGWLLVTGAVLSYAGGIIHTYYDVELAPAVAAVVAIAAVRLWQLRETTAARLGLAAGVLATVWWSSTLLGRSTGWHSWLAPALVGLGILAAIALLMRTDRARWAAAVGAGAGLLAVAGGSAAYALDTASTPHTGSVPSAGPASASRVGSAGFGGIGGVGGRAGGPPGAGRGSFELPGGVGGSPAGGFAGGTGGSPGSGTGGFSPPGGTGPAQQGGTAPTGRTAGGPGGAGNATVSAAVVGLLKNAGTTWSAATIGAQSAAPLELESGTAVMAIGGFGGSDPAPTLAQFERYVRQGKVRYFVSGGFGGGGGPGGGGTGSQISTWVQSHYPSTTVGGTTVYDLTKAKASSS